MAGRPAWDRQNRRAVSATREICSGAASARVMPPSASAEAPTLVVAPTSVPVRKTPRSGIRGWMVAASAAALVLLGAGAAAAQLIGQDDTPSATTTTTSSVEQASSAGETGQDDTGQEYTVQNPAPARPMGGRTPGRGGAGPR